MMDDILSPDGSPEDTEFARLVEQASWHLRRQRYVEAHRLIKRLLEQWPASTTAQELAGDLAFAEGRIPEARQHYRRALEIEPANADAERKYGLALLTQTPEERRAALVQDIIAHPQTYKPSARKPLNAVLHAFIFPGLGQIYNREHEKGLGLLAIAAVALIILLSILLPYLGALFALSSPKAKAAQIEKAQAAVEHMGLAHWLLVIFCAFVFIGVYLWGLWDAYRQAQSETAKILGV